MSGNENEFEVEGVKYVASYLTDGNGCNGCAFLRSSGCQFSHLIPMCGALVREDQDDVLDRVESDCHGHEEKGAVSVLHTLDSPVTVLEKNDTEDSGDNGDDEFNI
jgi:hypothetical protein